MGSRFPVPGKELLFITLLLGLMIPYQALVMPLSHVLQAWPFQHAGRSGPCAHHRATPLQRLPSAQQLRSGAEGAQGGGRDRRLQQWQTLWKVFLPLVKAGIVTVILFAFIASWNEFLGALIFMSRENNFTIPIMLVSARAGRHGAVDGARCRPASSSPSSPAWPSTCFCRSTTCRASLAAR